MTVLRSDSRRWMWRSKIVSDFDQKLDQEITVTHGRIRQGVVASNKCDGIYWLPLLDKGDTWWIEIKEIGKCRRQGCICGGLEGPPRTCKLAERTMLKPVMPKGRITEQLVVQPSGSIYGVGLWSRSSRLWHSKLTRITEPNKRNIKHKSQVPRLR